MTLPVLAAVLAAVALWPAPARAADPVAPPAWWTADALEAIGDGATVAMHIIVPPGRSLAAGDASEFPPLDRSLLERTRSLTLILQGDVGMAVFDGPGVGDPEVVAAIEGRCRAAGWRTDPATVAGIAARRLGAGVGGSLGMHLEIATTGSGAVLATQGRLAIRPRLTWRGGEGPGDFPGVVLLAAGSGRLVMVPGDDRHLAEWITASGTVPATATGAWMRRMMAEQRDGGAVVVAAGKVLGPPIAVAVVPDGPRIRLVGACRMPDAAQAAMLVDTLERAAAAADTLAAELAPHIRRFMVVRGTPEPGAIEASMHEIEQGIAGTIASTQVVPDGDQVRLVTRLGGQALDDLLMGITGVQ